MFIVGTMGAAPLSGSEAGPFQFDGQTISSELQDHLGDQRAAIVAAALNSDSGRLAVAGQWPEQHPQAIHLGVADDQSPYAPSALLVMTSDGQVQGTVAFAAGAFLPTDLHVADDGLWLAGYAGEGFARWLDEQQIPGLRAHDPSFAQRQWELHTPGEHHDEPRYDPRYDGRGAPAVLFFAGDALALNSAALLEGWQSTWFVPAQVQETWWQPVLLERFANGDIVVVHDGGYNLAPTPGQSLGFCEFSLAYDVVSRLTPDLTKRHWHTRMHGPTVDPQAISAHMQEGVHFRQTSMSVWSEPVLGNPRAWSLTIDGDDQLWVAGWSASRTAKEPWWCPFIRRVSEDGTIADGPWSPSPTAGGGRLGGQVSDTAVRAVQALRDGGMAVILLSDGGNNVSRRDPWDPLAEPKAPWFGQPDPFRGRTLFWSGLTRLQPAVEAPMNLELAWGLHLGGQSRDQRNRHTTRPAWAEQVVELDDGRLLLAGRVAEQTRILGRQSEHAGAWLGLVSADGREQAVLELWPQARIKAMVVSGSTVVVFGQRDGRLFVAQHMLSPPAKDQPQDQPQDQP